MTMAVELCLAIAALFSLAVVTRRTIVDHSLPAWSHYGSLVVLFLSLAPLGRGASVEAFGIAAVGSALALGVQEASLRMTRRNHDIQRR